METIAGTGYYNAGQDCTAATRVLASKNVYDDVVNGLAGRGQGPRARRHDGGRDDARPGQSAPSSANGSKGSSSASPANAEIVTGGVAPDLPGFFVEPTVVAGLEQDDEMIQKEIFGPVITVQPFDDEAKAIEWANGTRLRARLLGLDP